MDYGAMHTTNPSSQRSTGSSGGTSTRSSNGDPTLFPIDEFLKGIPQVSAPLPPPQVALGVGSLGR